MTTKNKKQQQRRQFFAHASMYLRHNDKKNDENDIIADIDCRLGRDCLESVTVGKIASY